MCFTGVCDLYISQQQAELQMFDMSKSVLISITHQDNLSIRSFEINTFLHNSLVCIQRYVFYDDLFVEGDENCNSTMNTPVKVLIK